MRIHIPRRVAKPIPSSRWRVLRSNLMENRDKLLHPKNHHPKILHANLQVCDGKSEPRTWVETESYNGCKDPNEYGSLTIAVINVNKRLYRFVLDPEKDSTEGIVGRFMVISIRI
ncbi:hypothetical protein [Paenibacillus alvei]|uniref:Uncharacterized protein n=1 Tax=Paenibacillus alvei TaxID=44250 RepID=A0AAP7DJA4_PAEAL|nr:hypothetical protein [Paenibacillus alvei]NOJ71740.1 hypothetical protein [Paenibacillus alvei]